MLVFFYYYYFITDRIFIVHNNNNNCITIVAQFLFRSLHYNNMFVCRYIRLYYILYIHFFYGRTFPSFHFVVHPTVSPHKRLRSLYYTVVVFKHAAHITSVSYYFIIYVYIYIVVSRSTLYNHTQAQHTQYRIIYYYHRCVESNLKFKNRCK
ncbi:unnamed protein product [Aphis gossypii]|uniref:Uncharacterized protein n=1 Tax=Aphis gossypii TaxID=80765 RepID=A0A9P0J460_APHGO|nr:unnamed protein product [Aphis gossypii]